MALYRLQMEGFPDSLRDSGYLSEVVTSWRVEGDVQGALVQVTPEQYERLRGLLHVKQLDPAEDGLYLGRACQWVAVHDGAVVATGGEGMVPREALMAVLGGPADVGEGRVSPGPMVSAAPVMPPLEPISAPAPDFRSATAPPPDTATETIVVAPARERDPVCGMELRPGQEEASVNYQGRTYHFCSAECRDLFLKTPSQYQAAVT
jgi:YHS domain-containing protein